MKYIVILFSVLFLLSCKADSNSQKTEEPIILQSSSHDEVSVQEVQLRVKEGKGDFVLLDVRTPDEIADGKIQGAKELNFRAAKFEDLISALPKNEEYLVYCASGGRSGKTVKMMKEKGFTNVHNVVGGYSAYTALKNN